MDENAYVYCTQCKRFNIIKNSQTDEYTPVCLYESKCCLEDCEDSKPFKERPMYLKRENNLENLIISIEENNGIKYIHYMGYGYEAGANDENDITPYRFVDYTGLIHPLDDVLRYLSPQTGQRGILAWEIDNQEFCKQYIDDYSFEDLNAVYSSYDNGKQPKRIFIEDLTINTPCGIYILLNQTKGA